MKITILLLITAILQVSARSYAQKITLSENNASINTIFNKISLQTGYDFLVNQTILNNAKPVTIKVKNVELKDVLEQIFKNQELEYELTDKIVKIKVKQPSFFSKILNVILAKNISGKVVDQNGNPLPGATVAVVGFANSTTTLQSGFFYLQNVNENATIRISYIGYVTRDLKASDDLSVIKLSVNESKLDEIKVIGYGTTTDRLSTGSSSTLTAADIAKQPVNNIFDAMIGRIPGMQITPASGIQGAAPKFVIRGAASVGANNTNVTNYPLFIIDGVPLPAASISLSNGGGIDNAFLNLMLGINPADVESISVLKDADATAIYGAKGGNGVVLITTKRGKATGTKVNLNMYTGIQQVGHFVDMLDVHQYNAVRREAFKNDGITPTRSNAPDLLVWDTTQVHDWQKEFIGRTASSYDVNFSVSGGSEKTHFYMSSAWHREGTVMPGDSKLDRRSFLGSVNHVSDNRKFTFNLQSGYSTTDLNLLPADLVGSIFLAPQNPLYNADGTPNWTSPASYPLANTLQKYQTPTKLFTGNVRLGYEIIPGLKVRANTGFNYGTIRQSIQKPLSSLNPLNNPTSGTLTMQSIDNGSWIFEPQAEYDRHIGKNHFNILAGGSWQHTYSNSIGYSGSNFANDALIGSIGSAGTVTVTSSEKPQAFASVFGRLSYDFDQEFLANFSARRDGSSRFGPNAKFANFGAVGLGWVFTQNKTVAEALPFLSFGKLRASYGVTGNDQIGDFGYEAIFGSVTGNSGYNGLAGLIAYNLQNPDYSWEKDTKVEGGIELGFLKDRIILNASYYRNRSGNQLISYNTSTQTGFYNYIANFDALVENKGVELELTSRNIQGVFNWSTSLNFTQNANTLIAYPNIATSSYSNTYIVGQPLSVIQAYKQNGLSNTGTPIYVDVDNSGSVTNLTPKDRVVAGNKNPRYGGINNDFNYKGFNLSFFIQYNQSTGYKLYVPSSVIGGVNRNYSTFVLGDRWQNPGDEAYTSVPRFTTNNGLYNTSYYNSSVQNLSTRNIFRLSNASVGYTVPASITKNLKLSQLQFYINAQNLYTLDKYRKYELDSLTGNSSLPPLRTIVFGINATF